MKKYGISLESPPTFIEEVRIEGVYEAGMLIVIELLIGSSELRALDLRQHDGGVGVTQGELLVA